VKDKNVVPQHVICFQLLKTFVVIYSSSITFFFHDNFRNIFLQGNRIHQNSKVFSYRSDACTPGDEMLRFREALHGPGKTFLLVFWEYLVGDLSKSSSLEYSSTMLSTSAVDKAVDKVVSMLTRYAAKASTFSHPG
jgi:hypothetical protein